uniref:RRM domain-containing protein n=1 Tax=Alexandrium catenella TaxID=2925 RepID=A0A7S1KW86_ALECA
MAAYGAVRFQPVRTVGPVGPYGGSPAGGAAGQLEDPACKVYVGNLSYQTKWPQLKDHFKQVGEVERASVVTEDGSDSGRSRGFGVVLFKTEEGAQAAIAGLNETQLDGRNILVDLWTRGSGKPRPAGKGAGAPLMLTNAGQGVGGMAMVAMGGGGKGCGKVVERSRQNEVRGENLVYVGNLKYEVKWKDLKEHMKQAGNVEFCNVLTEDGTEFGRSRGIGCVRYSSEAEVQQAIAMLNESDLMGRNILVDHWTSSMKQ